MSNQKKLCKKLTRELKKILKGKSQHHILVMARMITGLVMSKNAQLPKIAAEVPSNAKDPSLVRQFQRFVANEHVDVAQIYLPFASQILAALSDEPLLLAMDASTTGRGCMTMMVGVIYKNRLLPLSWLVYEGKKGHTTAARHTQVLQSVLALIPVGAQVILLGDGEYDSIELLNWIRQNAPWKFTLRTAKNLLVREWQDEDEPLMQVEESLELQPNSWVGMEDTFITTKQFGPIHVLGWWEDDYDHPWYLLTNIDDFDLAGTYYKKRAIIETFFSDQKSRGFFIDKSHISCPDRLNRLMLTCCLAYLWMIGLGLEIIQTQQVHLIDHKSRRDKSVFRLGLDWLRYCLKHGLPFSVRFEIPKSP